MQFYVRIIDKIVQITYARLMRTDLLASMGISEKAAKIYLTGLTLGTTSVQELARKTRIKRPTVYLQIDELLKRGLFEKVSLNNKQYYRPVEPQILETHVKKNLAALQDAMPELLALQTDTRGKPQVRILEGEDGIKQIYGEMKEASSWRIWSNLAKIYPLFGDTYAEISNAVRRNGIGVREIIADNKESRRYSRLLKEIAGPTYSARLATVEGLANDTIVYGNVVAIFRLHEFNMFVVRIEDQSIAESMKALFDMAWKATKAFK